MTYCRKQLFNLLFVLLVQALTTTQGFVVTTPRSCPAAILPATSGRPTFLLAATPEPLATEGDWNAYLDEEGTGLIYYFNGRTGESRWVAPTSSFPSVELSRKQKRLADEKQREYRKAVKLEESNRKGLLAALLEPEQTETAVATAEEEKEEWFSFLRPTKDVEAAAEQPAAVEEEAAAVGGGGDDGKGGGDWFNFWPKDTPASQGEIVVEEAPEDFFEEPVEEEVNGAAAVVEEPVVLEEEPVVLEPVVKEKPVKKARGAVFDRLFPGSVEIEKEPAADVEEVEIIAPQIGSYVSPDPKKILWGGEDAVFVSGRNFGVFDGVSGATKDGRKLYSVTMANQMKQNIGVEGVTIPKICSVMGDAVMYANQKATGATTAVVGSINDDGTLRVLNVGDSTCIVIRDGKVIAKTKERNHFYECPFQFSEISTDKPRDGTKMTVSLRKGDLIVMASDGIFDNLYDEEVVEVVLSAKKKSTPEKAIAKRIVEKSRAVSLNPKAETPFAKEALRKKNPDYPNGVGGKVDDASCVVVSYA